MQFSAIRTEVQTLLIDASTAVVNLTPNFVNRAITKLQQKHNFKVMEAKQAYTTTALTRTLGARPSNWKEARGVPYYVWNLGGFTQLVYAPSEADALAAFGNSTDTDYGSPRALLEDEDTASFLAYPYPDSLSDYSDGQYRITVPYWKYLPVLSADTDTNWFTENATQWVIYQAVAEGFYANEDVNQATVWEKRASREYGDVLLADKRRSLANVNTLVPHLGARKPHLEE